MKIQMTFAAIALLIVGLYATSIMKKAPPPTTQSLSYAIKIISVTNSMQPKQETKIVYKIIDEQGNGVKDFLINHTKLMHFIVVRKDLQDFQHLHPDFNKDTGEFTIPVTFSTAGSYRLFADYAPTGGQKDPEGNVLGVTSYQDINVGDMTKYKPQDVVPDIKTATAVGEYQIEYSIPQLQAGKEAKITLHVLKGGRPVTDMEEYLEALAHGILLSKDTLDFVHLHDMGPSITHMMNGKMMTMKTGSTSGPDVVFTYTFPSKGIYKLFTQFQHQGNVITTGYVVSVN